MKMKYKTHRILLTSISFLLFLSLFSSMVSTATAQGTSSTATYAYITNGGSNSVSVIDTATNTVAATVSVGSSPQGVAFSPDGTLVYVANFGSGTVSVIDTATNAIAATINAGKNPYSVAITPDGTKIYVTNYGSSTVSVIDTTTNKLISTLSVGGQPFGVAVTETEAYVTNDEDQTVSVIDTTTDTVTSTIDVENEFPGGVAVAGSEVYVTSGSTGNVSVIDIATNTVTETVSVGAKPHGVAVSPDGTMVYVANLGSNSVSVIDTGTKAVVATVKVGKSPYGVAVSPDGNDVYAVNDHDNSVSVIDTDTNTVRATVKVGDLPKALGQFVGTIPVPEKIPETKEDEDNSTESEKNTGSEKTEITQTNNVNYYNNTQTNNVNYYNNHNETNTVNYYDDEPAEKTGNSGSEHENDIESDPSKASSASVNLHGEKTKVAKGEDILLKLSAVNLITKPTMHVQAIIIPPSGMSVSSTEFVESGAGQYTTTYELEPGKGRDIEVRIAANQVGDFNVTGRVVYYFGNNKKDGEDYTLDLPIQVEAPVPPTTYESASGLINSIPGLGAPGLVFILMLVFILRRNS